MSDNLYFFFIFLAFVILLFVAMWKIYSKAGQPGWAVLVPFYSQYILLKIVGRPGWWLLLYFIPLVNLIIMIIVNLGLAKVFGRSTLFGIVWLILFSPVGILILGFGKSQYQNSTTPPQPALPASPAVSPSTPQNPNSPVSPPINSPLI